MTFFAFIFYQKSKVEKRKRRPFFFWQIIQLFGRLLLPAGDGGIWNNCQLIFFPHFSKRNWNRSRKQRDFPNRRLDRFFCRQALEKDLAVTGPNPFFSLSFLTLIFSSFASQKRRCQVPGTRNSHNYWFHIMQLPLVTPDDHPITSLQHLF